MSVRMQAVLLRFLETGEIQRVGADGSASSANVRVIAATNRNLLSQIAEKSFRDDLLLPTQCDSDFDSAPARAERRHLRPA